MIKNILIYIVGVLLLSGCRNGIVMGNMMNTSLHHVSIKWDGFAFSRMHLGGGLYSTREKIPDQFLFEWQDSKTKQIKSIVLDVPDSAQGYPWGALVVLTHSNGVVEVMHRRNGKVINGYKKQVTDEW